MSKYALLKAIPFQNAEPHVPSLFNAVGEMVMTPLREMASLLAPKPALQPIRVTARHAYRPEFS